VLRYYGFLRSLVDETVYYCLQAVGRVSYHNANRNEKYILLEKVG